MQVEVSRIQVCPLSSHKIYIFYANYFGFLLVFLLLFGNLGPSTKLTYLGNDILYLVLFPNAKFSPLISVPSPTDY